MKALGLFSGGLDSMIAIKLIQKQGIDVEAVAFISPFFGNKEKLEDVAKKNDFKLTVMDVSEEYVEMMRKPKHGYGKHLNPCIDCKIFMLKKAKEFQDKIGAKFIFTGEVMGQRPMSQMRPTLELIEEEAGLNGVLLRPLSAKLLPDTLAEKNGWVKKENMLDLHGRGRDSQLRLAKEMKLIDYGTPAGGCVLTHEEYTKKLKDLLSHNKSVTLNDIYLIKIGRHFRFKESMIIVGRSEDDNKKLTHLKGKSDYSFCAVGILGPITLLQGKKSDESIRFAAELTARYSDAKRFPVEIKYDKGTIKIDSIDKDSLDRYRLV